MYDEWRDILGFNGRYQVSNTGEVRSWLCSSRSKTKTAPNILKSAALKSGHCYISLGRKYKFLVHRLVWEAFKGPIPYGYEIDHKDRNPQNNCLDNLRLSTRAQNRCNQKVYRIDTKSSRFKGVSFDNKRKVWHVYINVSKKRSYLGCYEDEVDAAKAYNTAAVSLHKEFAALNNIPNEVN